MGLDRPAPAVVTTPAYGPDLAAAHHEGFGNFSRSAVPVLLDTLPPEAAGGLVVDLGSGSGILARLLTDAGFEVLGVDISPDMVALARTVAPDASFVCAPLLDVDLPACVAVTAVGEILNYAFDPRHGLRLLDGLFGRVAAALAPGGTFLFDVAGPGRAGPARSYEVFRDEADSTLFSRAGEDEAGSRLVRRITLFRRVGDAYRRSDEEHVLHLHRPDDVERALAGAGFAARRIDRYGGLALPHGLHGFVATRRRARP
jgi:SAM-dependent methyltransferase